MRKGNEGTERRKKREIVASASKQNTKYRIEPIQTSLKKGEKKLITTQDSKNEVQCTNRVKRVGKKKVNQ
jgi:hypothetical protein